MADDAGRDLSLSLSLSFVKADGYLVDIVEKNHIKPEKEKLRR